jgi:O-acetyl-ADP-ribose deacetylase (regulator of RNase III)
MYDFISRIKIVKGDLTAQTGVDAIVSSIYPDMTLGGSLNRAVMAAAGADLDNFILENIFKPRTGDAFAVPGFNLPVPHILFMVKPRWRDGFFEEDKLLQRGYRRVVELAHTMGLRAIAIPALGSGVKQFPAARVARLALQGIADRQLNDLEEIRIVCNRDETFESFQDQLRKLRPR